MTGTDSGKPQETTDPRSAEGAGDDGRSLSDADQTASDADQAASEIDDAEATADQLASDEDQRLAYQNHLLRHDPASDAAYETSRLAREAGTLRRLAGHVGRATAGRIRADTADARDVTSATRDELARRRDAEAEEWERANASADSSLAEKFEQLRARAAADRRRAAEDRAEAARERARLEAELHTAHLDDLTGAYRREVGLLTLKHEMDRARRGSGRLVVAFVDIDGMKQVNDRDGHAAGDHVLQTLVWTMRSNLRSFDPVVRYGGDEFVAGLGGVDVDEAARRFAEIDQAVESEVGVGFSVGLAELEHDETLEALLERADARLLSAKARQTTVPPR